MKLKHFSIIQAQILLHERNLLFPKFSSNVINVFFLWKARRECFYKGG